MNLYVDLIAAQPISVEPKIFETGAVVMLDYAEFALVITNWFVSIYSEGRKKLFCCKHYHRKRFTSESEIQSRSECYSFIPNKDWFCFWL